MAEQAFVAYDGQYPKFIRCSATRSHGPYPDAIQLDIPPTLPADIPVGGDFYFYLLPSDTRERWWDCLTDSASFRADGSGFLTTITILDRRWKWAFPTISGHYNVRMENGSIRNDILGGNINQTLKTPQELATLLLTAMGEQNFSVADLPNDSRPEVRWELANAASELHAMCELLGCRIVLQRDNTVAIRKTGEGADLPDGPFMEEHATIDPANKPDKVAVVYGPDRFQHDFLLEPVGLDTDGKIKHINNLSFKPQNGWDYADLENFLDSTLLVYKELAKEWVYKAYRIVEPFFLPTAMQQGSILINRREEILPIENYQCSTKVDANGVEQSIEAFVYGVWNGDGDGGIINQGGNQIFPIPPGLTNDTIVKRPYTIDTKRGIVHFTQPIWKYGANWDFKPADLRLRCACSYRDPNTRALQRQFRGLDLPPFRGTEFEVLKRDDLVVNHIPTYDNAFFPLFVNSNVADINLEAEQIITQHLRKYQTQVPMVRKYSGIINQELDGAIMRISYDESGQGPTTTISRNIDNGTNSALPYVDKSKAAMQKRMNQIGWAMGGIIGRGLGQMGKLLGIGG